MDENTLAALDQAVAALATKIKAASKPVAPDAIDEINAAPRRIVGVQSLRNTPEYQAAVQAIADGRIAADGLHKALDFANMLVGLALKAV